MFDEIVNELQQKLVSEKDFSIICDYFLTNIGENPSFLKKSKKTKHPIIKDLVKAIGKRLFPNQEINIAHLLLQKIKGHKLIHGAFFINGHIGSVFYFDDINMGLIMISHNGTQMFRISSHMIEKNKDSSFKEGEIFIPPVSKSIH